LAATGGGLAGYFGTKDEKRKKRNAITGALLGGGASTAMQLALAAADQPGDTNTETPGGANDLARLTGGLGLGRLGFGVGAMLRPTDKRVGELARAAQPVTAGRTWADWYNGRGADPANNKQLLKLFKDLGDANNPSTGRTTGDAVDAVLADSRAKSMSVRTKDVLVNALNRGQLPPDAPGRSWSDWLQSRPAATPEWKGSRAEALKVLSSAFSPSGAKGNARIDAGAIGKFFDARQRGVGRFGVPTAGGIIGGLTGTLGADSIMNALQNAMSSSSEAK
jgi:hypothetical protein